MFSDLADMSQSHGTRCALFDYYSKESVSTPPSIIEFAKRPGTTAKNLYYLDRATSVLFSGLGHPPRSREGFCVFYSDRAIAYSLSKSLTTLEYSGDDCDVLRLPYSSSTLLQFWDNYKKRQRWPSGIHNFVSIWLILEHFQQVRWYAIMDATTVSEVQTEQECILSQFPEEDIALKRRVRVALNTVIGTPVTDTSQRLLMLAASVLSFTTYTPSEKEILKNFKPLGVDKTFSPAIRTMIRTMKEQDKLSKFVPMQRVRFDAILRWQRAIRIQIKQNRNDREQTAHTRVETRKREIVRARCNAAKLSRDAGHVPSQPGPSGPQKKVNWVARDADTPSEIAKREAKKKMAREAIMLNAEDKRVQMERQANIEAERLRNLQIADDIMKG